MAHGIVGILATGSKLVDVCVFVLFAGEGERGREWAYNSLFGRGYLCQRKVMNDAWSTSPRYLHFPGMYRLGIRASRLLNSMLW